MQILSASEALGPAWERARQVLLEPFEWRRFPKFAAVAALAALGSSSPFTSFGGGGHGHHGAAHSLPPAAAAALAAALAVIGLVFFVVSLLLFYVGSRMQFVLFEVVAKGAYFVGPVWSRYGRRTWRWMGLKFLILFAMLVVALAAMLPVFIGIARHSIPGHSHAQALRHMLPTVTLGVALILAMIAVYFLVLDFALPVIALEDASLATALGRVCDLIQASPGEVFLYILLRILMSAFFTICVGAAVALTGLLSFIPFGLVGGALFQLLHRAGLAGHILMAAALTVEAFFFAVWMICVYVAVIGYLYTFLQAYALYFLGGRYRLLGDLLEPPPAAVDAPEPPAQTPPAGLPPMTSADEVW